jgi:hypothetical protein
MMLSETVLTTGDGAMYLWDPRTGTIFASYKITGTSPNVGCMAVGKTTVRGGELRPSIIFVPQTGKAMMHVYQFEKAS